MTQKEVDVLFEMMLEIHENNWFGTRNKPKRRDVMYEWVSKQLAKNLEVYTIPIGASWGVLVSKERFDEYWKENSNIKV